MTRDPQTESMRNHFNRVEQSPVKDAIMNLNTGPGAGQSEQALKQ